MVGDFAAIRHAANIRFPGASLPKGHIAPQPEDQGSGGCLHILRQILAVRPGIGRQFFLIKRLHIVKGLLSRITINAVTFPL